MSDKNIYKLFKELDDCDKRCLKKLIENEEKDEATDEQIKELAKWLKKDHYSADSMDPVVTALDKRYKDTSVDFIFLESINLQGYKKDKYITVLIRVQCKGNYPEIYDIQSLLEKEIEQRRFLTSKKTVEQLIASTKKAYKEEYGDE